MPRSIAALSLLMLPLMARAEEVVRVGHLPSASPAALTCLSGVAAGAGLRIETRLAPSEAWLVEMLGRGEIDAAVVSPELALSARAGGAPVVLISGFAPSRARILARRSLGLTTVAGLRHRRIGLPRGGGTELLMLSELRAASLSWSTDDAGPQDVQLVYLAPADLDAALRSGYVDAVVQLEPLAERAVQGGYGTLLPGTTGDRLDALVTSEAALADRQRLSRLVRCLVGGFRIMEAHRALAGDEAGALERSLWRPEYRDLPPQPLRYAIRAEDVERTEQQMAELGVGRLGEARPARQLVRLELLADALAAAP